MMVVQPLIGVYKQGSKKYRIASIEMKAFAILNLVDMFMLLKL